VLTGPRTQVAHGLPSHRTLGAGELAIIDLHPAVDGYRSELCRTACCGQPSPEQQATYDLYLKAQQATIAAARPGASLRELERIMAHVVGEGGRSWQSYGAMVHGIGIELEEAPAASEHAILGQPEPPPLESNVVLSVGNRTLCTGEWGIRVEDTIVVGDEGPECLTEFPRRLAL
jgi:Xaa-Pro aminopeptidase